MQDNTRQPNSPLEQVSQIVQTFESAHAGRFSASKIDLKDPEFEAIRSLVYNTFGIKLADHKRSLVKSRLEKHVLSGGFQSYRDYLEMVKSDRSGEAIATLANRITTNYTYFYREQKHFEFLSETVLPEIVAGLNAKNSKDLRIWCAGCSSGEEPYTLQMLCMEFFGNQYKSWDAGILATDISTKALRYAIRGIYPTESAERLPPALRNKYFEKFGADQLKVVEAAKKEVLFRRFNLMQATFPFKKRFHTIFCRNVMIYFDQPTRDALVNRYAESMEPGGYLFIGHSETLGRSNEHFKYVMPATYQRV